PRMDHYPPGTGIKKIFIDWITQKSDDDVDEGGYQRVCDFRLTELVEHLGLKPDDGCTVGEVLKQLEPKFLELVKSDQPDDRHKLHLLSLIMGKEWWGHLQKELPHHGCQPADATTSQKPETPTERQPGVAERNEVKTSDDEQWLLDIQYIILRWLTEDESLFNFRVAQLIEQLGLDPERDTTSNKIFIRKVASKFLELMRSDLPDDRNK